ncbi:MAG: sigma-70 family RNA polymerase sigma factor [Kiritimatiellae bacterium]|jgi:RNA polymerase sigma factor (sigma-70 family)|nr:sigma-70 family RNA polymerase sigma factor [Kiritimatiellia bacterium]
MSTFPETSFTLIAKIKDLARGQDSAVWNRFWDLYAPAMRAFAVFKGAGSNADDIVMTVLAKLVDVLRSGQYQPEKGSFHSYLATMIYNEVHMQRRKDEVRKADSHVPLDEVMQETLAAPGQAPETDVDWQRAILAAAMEHVLTKTALSDRDREIYRFYVQEGHSIDETSEKFHQSRNNISQIKTRIEKRIAAIGREMAAAAERI